MGRKIKNTYRLSVLIAIFVSIIPLMCYGSSSSLLQMDVKKSGVSDTLDVTFYTTGENANTVVTRKSNNKYVVLLPNTSGNSSIVPNLGGVKDLVTDIQVKNVDDGIGGYTKVTFDTTKPINIKTYTKKTDPLTQAQKDYKNLIAQNSSKPVSAAQSAKTSAAAKATVPTKPISTAVSVPSGLTKIKTTVSSAVNQANNLKSVSGTKQKDNKTVEHTEKKVELKQENKQPEKIAQNNPTKEVSLDKNTSEPLNGKDTNEVSLQDNQSKDSNLNVKDTNFVNKGDSKDILDSKAHFVLSDKISILSKSIKNVLKNKKSLFGKLKIIAGLFLIGMLLQFIKGIFRRKNKPSRKYNYDGSITPEELIYNNILNSNDMNWQEKYKMYNEKTQDINEVKQEPSVSYVTNMKNDKGKVVVHKPELPQQKNASAKTIKNIINIPSVAQRKTSTAFQNKIKKMELEMFDAHSSVPDITEDDLTYDMPSDVKLTSFADEQLSSAQQAENNNIVNKQECGRFVKLKNSEIDKSDKSLNNYQTSSLYDFLSLLEDGENKQSIPVSHSTNPISPKAPIGKKNLVVKSGVDLDKTRSIYLVDANGSSALVGRVNENIFVLKKFDKYINEKVQVRRDKNGSYIVKAGAYKCLVDVASDKMGVLVEI